MTIMCINSLYNDRILEKQPKVYTENVFIPTKITYKIWLRIHLMNYIHRLTYKCLFCNIMCCIYVTLQIQVMARKDFRVILYLYKNIRGVQHLCNFTANTQFLSVCLAYEKVTKFYHSHLTYKTNRDLRLQ